MISIKEKEEHLKKLNSELDSKRNAMMQQLVFSLSFLLLNNHRIK